MYKAKPFTNEYKNIIENIEKGIYQIPKFQRDFVWDLDSSVKLIDSIIKGYPIGSFVLWKTKERLKSIKKIGGKILKESNDEYIYYILDGQQRITSLFLSNKGIEVDGKDFKNIYISLSEFEKFLNHEEVEEIVLKEKKENSIALSDLMNMNLYEIIECYGLEFNKKIVGLLERIKDRFKEYKFSLIEISDTPIEVVSEIFTRINTGGKELTLFEIMNAKIYDENNFDLEDRVNEIDEKLNDVGYDTLLNNRNLILQYISLILNSSAKRKDILKIKKEEFVAVWNKAIDGLFLAIDKLRSYYLIPVSALLPYNTLAILLAYLFYQNDLKDLDFRILEEFKKFFYRSAFTERYSSAVESKLNNDIKLMQKILKENLTEEDFPFNETKDTLLPYIKEYKFSPSYAFDKGVLSILATFKPKRFNDNGEVILDNAFLKRKNSKNYHHFFPKAFLKDKNTDVLANITFIDEYLNKKISNKPPSKYLKGFNNPCLKDTLKSHLIDLDEDDILNDNFEKFVNNRSERIVREILKVCGK